MASIIFFRAALAGLGLAGCAAPAPPPAPIATRAPSPAAVVLVTRALAPPETRGAVLLVLTGSPAGAGLAPPGYDVIAQTADGSLKSCIAPQGPPLRPGASVTLADGTRCGAAHIAAAAAIR